MNSYEQEFLLKEYDKLNNEVAKLLEETRTREKYSLTVTALVAAWIYTEVVKLEADVGKSDELISIIRLLGWLPLMITFFYGISVLLIYKNIEWIGEYLSIIEEKFLKDLDYRTGERFGWEKFLNMKNRKLYFVTWTWVIWLLQIAISASIIWKSYSLTS